MTLYTFLTVFLIAWAIAVLVITWKQQRKFEESQAEIERLPLFRGLDGGN